MRTSLVIVGAGFGLAVVGLLGLVGYGFAAPTQWEVERTAVADASVPDVLAWVEDPTTWKEWALLDESGGDMERIGVRVRGREAPFELEWSTARNHGVLTIGPTDEFGVSYVHERFGGTPAPNPIAGQESRPTAQLFAEGTITAAPHPEGVAITWYETGDVGLRPIGPFMASFVRRGVDEDIALGLETLARLSEVRAHPAVMIDPDADADSDSE